MNIPPVTPPLSSLESLPHDVGGLIVAKVFEDSEKDYQALLQTCSTIHTSWNLAFFQHEKGFPLYKKFFIYSRENDARVCALFQAVLGEKPSFPGVTTVELDLTDNSTEQSWQQLADCLPNCKEVAVTDNRAPHLPRLTFAAMAKALFDGNEDVPDDETWKASKIIAAFARALLKYTRIHISTHALRPFHPTDPLFAVIQAGGGGLEWSSSFTVTRASKELPLASPSENTS